jgi:hypothetical protein
LIDATVANGYPRIAGLIWRIPAECPALGGGLTSFVGVCAAWRFDDSLRWVHCKHFYSIKQIYLNKFTK